MREPNSEAVPPGIDNNAIRTAFDTAAVIIIVLSPDHKILEFNQEAEQLYGQKREQDLGKNYIELFLPREVWGQVAADIDKVLAGKSTRGFENTVKTDDHGERLLSWSVSRLLDDFGRPTGVVAIGHDITEIKEAEAALHESHRLLQAITEGTSDVIYVKDAELRYLLVNTVTAQALGLKPEDIIGRHDWEILPEDLAPIITETDKRIMNSGQLNILEEEVAGRIWSVKKWPLRDDDGKIIGIVGISRDITDSKRRQGFSDALNRISASISSTLDFDEIIQRAIREAAQSMGCESGALILYEDDYWVFEHLYKLDKASIGDRFSDEQVKHLTLVAKTQEMLAVADCRIDNRVDQELMRELGIGSFLAIPLIIRGSVIGVLAFHYRSATSDFDDAQIDFAAQVGSSVSLAVENARLYSEQRSIADTLQETLLTTPEEIRGLDFGHLYRAATEIAKVGGDFFDLFELKEDMVGILIGDVSGKGLEAAKVTSMIKNTIHAHAHEENSPAQILEKTNRSACRTIPPGSFATVFFGILETTTGMLTYCNAGHPPAIVRRNAGADRYSFLTTSNGPIGALEGFAYNDGQIRLEKGDLLFIYTDGLIEARNGDLFYGEKRLREAIEESVSIPTSELPRAIFDRVLSFTDGRLVDDVAILSVSLDGRRKP